MIRLASLVNLYPRAWRRRHAAELTDLVESLSAERGALGRLFLGVDLARGALDAHLQQRRLVMRRLLSDLPVRHGVTFGAVLGTTAAVVLFLSNVVFPPGPEESDDDPEYLVQIGIAYFVLAAVLVLAGAAARRVVERRGDDRVRWAGAKAGAAAGVVLALIVLVAVLVIDNAFFATVSQQHDKRVAFAESGWSSMRLFVNVQILTGALTVPWVAGAFGGLLGAVGGVLGRSGARRRSRLPST